MEKQLENFTEPEINTPDILPVLPLRDVVVFPYFLIPLSVGRPASIEAVNAALEGQRFIFLATQKNPEIEEPTIDQLYPIGTVAVIIKMLKMPDGTLRILVQGIHRAKIKSLNDGKPYYKAAIERVNDKVIEKDVRVEALMRTVLEQFEKAVKLGKTVPPEFLSLIATIEEPGKLSDFITNHLNLKIEEQIELLEETNPIKRLEKINNYLAKEIAVLELQQKITLEAKDEIDKSQREYFLRQQLKAILHELGESEDFEQELEEYREKLKKTPLNEEARKEAEKQIKRLARMHGDSAEASVVRTYLDWLFDLPWGKFTEDNLDILKAKKILDKEHYGLKEVKERILEYLAVRKIKKDMKGPILCFVGPPGVGKTSLGRSIANALNRKFIRMSIGGVKDEAEIRGHRRTYVGAMPGRIIQGIKQAGTMNPVFMLDEVDKIGADFRGDPSNALLEALDPEQNNSFRDHYLGVPFDLSGVMFITTANQLDTIQPAFLDRMEVIHIPGYTLEEKVEIAKRHLIPKQMKENGVPKGKIKITSGAIKKIVEGYTREAGVRNLERLINKLIRKIIFKMVENNEFDNPEIKYAVKAKDVKEFLGAEKILEDRRLKENRIGVATGLAWTPFGGDILFIETSVMRGNGRLILTGQLGDVMKESAQAALSYLRANEKKYGLEEFPFDKKDIHIHVPAGAIPKDGPSAGITLATSLLSALTEREVKASVAMTGEITLRGDVLAVGGLKEKILAAKRAGIVDIIAPKENRNEIEEIEPQYLEGLKIHYVKNVDEVFKLALVK
ncbi:ATP-dependent Lon protease [Thermotomaculum hydrothermale]|uniref:Lon protease n=1 Tax=Thermotomaculum hydrothermale TaxID=981385 RepID=A0A7R6SZS5_9BACT|nr:endopeptidase La [Thermotomaculum hydrothermale]BBB33032.1 ATP-dependent Lon protease [Thermotomaculum hydrothermale]